MTIGNSYNVSALIFSLLVAFVYFYKKRIASIENRIYQFLLITSILGCVISIPTYYLVRDYQNFSFLTVLVPKLYLVYLIVWVFLLTSYVIIITGQEDEKIVYHIIRKILLVLVPIIAITILALPIEYFSENGVVYTYGLSVNFTYLVCGIQIAYWFISLIMNFKTVKSKKCIPIISVFILGALVAIIQKTNPSIRLMTPTITFVTMIMYFTIENPDMKMIEELNIAKDLAEKANNAKSEFLSSMSHEIRTPLNAIDGFAQLIMEEESMHIIKDEAKDIISASQNLIEIVNGILDISKIEADKLEIVDAIYEPTKIFDELEKLTIARIGDKPIELKTKIAKDLPEYLNGDYVRVKQIVLNLLTNAAKYTREGRIDFNVECVKKNNVCRLIISVKDTGIGIKKENLDAIFNKFERMDLDKNMTIEGTGLGLAITKRLVELMKGKIVVDSVYGKGSTFTVSIDQKIANPKIIKEEKKDSKEPKLNVKGKKVLIVDDNAINLKVAERLLLQYKVETTTATSGVECLDKVDNNAYDIILMDDMMPKMSGTETLNELKKRPHFKTPVIALTANAIVGMKEKYLNAGFDDYLSKPIDKQELERVLKAYLMK